MRGALKRIGCFWIAGMICLLTVTGPAPARSEDRPAAAAQADAKSEAAAPAPAAADGEKPAADLTVSALNLYYYQGRAFSRNSLVIQPSLTVGYGGFSAGLWGNLDTNPYPLDQAEGKHSGNWTETDVTLSYGKTFGRVSAGLSYAYYGIAGANAGGADVRDQHDLGVSLKLNTLLNPALNVYYMFDNSQRWYFMIGISHTVEIRRMISLKLAATAGYLASDMGTADMDGAHNRIDDSGNVLAEKYNNFLDGMVSITLPVKLTKFITLTPSIAFAFPLGKDAENYMKYNSCTDAAMNFSDKPSSFLIYGLAAGFGF